MIQFYTYTVRWHNLSFQIYHYLYAEFYNKMLSLLVTVLSSSSIILAILRDHGSLHLKERKKKLVWSFILSKTCLGCLFTESLENLLRSCKGTILRVQVNIRKVYNSEKFLFRKVFIPKDHHADHLFWEVLSWRVVILRSFYPEGSLFQNLE